MNILINATATRTSGGLSVLNQFIDNIPTDTRDFYYIFVNSSHKQIKKQNVFYQEKNTISWLQRIKWDEFGLRKWIKSKKIKVDLFISLQNTGSNLPDEIPQLIYYHQFLALVDFKWNVFSKQERIPFLYKLFYPYFVSRHLKKSTHVVVQAFFIKKAFVRLFSIQNSHVHVIPSAIKYINYDRIININWEDEYIHLLYPAVPLIYKNHELLIKALSILKKKNNKLFLKIRIHFTFESCDNKHLYSLIQKEGCVNNIVFEGVLNPDILLSLYKSCNILLFPSFIETMGLPLLEGAAAGLPIIVSDLPYAQEAIGSYEGAFLVEYANAEIWADKIQELSVSAMRFPPYLLERNSWNDFFNLINILKIK